MTEIEKLCNAVDEFAAAMKLRLIQKQKEGFRGWNTDINSIPLRLSQMAERVYLLGKGSEKKTLIDVANFAMMIWRKVKA
jgi:hypothetical protein